MVHFKHMDSHIKTSVAASTGKYWLHITSERLVVYVKLEIEGAMLSTDKFLMDIFYCESNISLRVSHHQTVAYIFCHYYQVSKFYFQLATGTTIAIPET
jgi:hypothetical protein